jgi:hypothetical protein
MEQKYSTWSADEIIVIDCDGSEPITPRPKVFPILNEEEQALADAVRRYQKEHLRPMLTWRDIFQIIQSLGYRKVEQPSAPPPPNGNTQDPARPDDAGNGKPS